MTTSELRYGNYVTYKGKVFQVNDIFGASGLITVLPDEENDRPGRLAVQDFAPLPLSEVWLEKFGFKLAGVAGMYYLENFGVDSGEFWAYSRVVKKMETTFPRLRKLTHVHELQNLHHALTGHELTANK